MFGPAWAQDDQPVEPGSEVICDQRAAPGPDQEGGWGPLFRTSRDGLVPIVDVHTWADHAHRVEVRVSYGGGRSTGWTAGPYEPSATGVFPVEVPLPDDLGTSVVRITVRVEAADQEGRPVGHTATHAYAWRDAVGVEHLGDEAAAMAAVGADSSQDGPIGLEVSR